MISYIDQKYQGQATLDLSAMTMTLDVTTTGQLVTITPAGTTKTPRNFQLSIGPMPVEVGGYCTASSG